MHSKASLSVHLEVCIFISAPKIALFIATHISPKKTRIETPKTDNYFPKVVQQHVGEMGNSITFALHIISIYSVPSIV